MSIFTSGRYEGLATTAEWAKRRSSCPALPVSRMMATPPSAARSRRAQTGDRPHGVPQSSRRPAPCRRGRPAAPPELRAPGQPPWLAPRPYRRALRLNTEVQHFLELTISTDSRGCSRGTATSAGGSRRETLRVPGRVKPMVPVLSWTTTAGQAMGDCVACCSRGGR
jgi:hypothetical protein